MKNILKRAAPKILLVSALLMVNAANTEAGILTVTKTADTNDLVCDGDCSLREAILAAAPGDEIQFASPLFDSPQIITLSDTLRTLRIGKSLTITGKGAQSLTIRRSPSATVNFLIVDIDVTGEVSLSGLTITGGGGVNIASGGATLTNCVITGNTAVGGFAGGISIGGSSQGVNLINSTVSNNTSNIPSGNTAAGIRTHASVLNIINSTISGNSLTGGGSGNGGAIRNSGSGAVSITNSTIINNSTDGLSSTNAGGIGNLSGTVTIRNTIVAGNNGTVPDVYGDIDGLYLSSGYNLIGKNTGATTYFPAGNPNANNDIVGTSASPIDPRLDPLGLYGGTTPTHRLQKTPVVSPAIDNGSNLGGLTTDQRGLMRPYDDPAIPNAGGASANGSDIGAFEVQAPPPLSNVQFSTTSYSVDEGAGFATITVTRAGDTSSEVTVDFETSDVGAQQRTDYTLAAETVTFDPGQTSKTFRVLIVDDVYVEGNETLDLTLSNPTGGAVLVSPSTAVLTIVDNDSASAATNPIDGARFFVQLHYYDFLSRYPDTGGWDFWTNTITACGADQTCVNNKHTDVSNAFYYELEFQQTGSYAYRLYRAAFGNNQPFPNPNPDPLHPGEEKKVPSYLPFMKDRARVRGGAELAVLQLALASAFVQRAEFTDKYPTGLDGPGFVDALLGTINTDLGVNLTAQRQALIDLFNTGGRGSVLYRLADDNVGTNPINNQAFIDAEYTRAFVFTQYAGYLRRNADMSGFLFWLGQVNSAPLRDVPRQHAMVCAFITSAEYQQRFSSVVTHSNAECQQ